MTEMMMIAGIPATEWVGRRIHFRGHPNKQHGTPGLIMKLAKRKVGVKPINHKKIEWFAPEAIIPKRSLNADLFEKYHIAPEVETLTAETEEDYPVELVEVEMAAVDQIEEEPLEEEVRNTADATRLRAEEILTKKRPRMIIHNHNAAWLPAYEEYQSALRAEASDLAMQEELTLALLGHAKHQQELVVKLASLGVQIVYDDDAPQAPASPAQTSPPPVVESAFYPFALPDGRGKSRMVIDRAVGRWTHHMKERLKAGEEIRGTVAAWARKLNTSQITLLKRLDRVKGITIVDDAGNEGSQVKGMSKILLA